MLLRGINVGTHNRIAMADLRALLADLGYTDVVTLLNSGNAVVATPVEESVTVARTIEDGITGRFGLSVRTIVRNRADMVRVLECNPMPGEAERAPKLFHVGFCDPVPADALARIDRRAVAPDRLELDGGTVYAWFAKGLRNSALAKALGARGVGEHITLRNWNTVRKLVALGDSEEPHHKPR